VWEPYASSRLWNLSSGEGLKSVFVEYRDNVDLSVGAYQTVMLDLTPPVANAGLNQTVMIGTAAVFYGGGSTDNTGVTSYLWSFGDGSTGTGVTPTHNYTTVGNYTVTLTVVDLAGNRAASSSVVTVQVIIPEFSSVAALAAVFLLTGVVAFGKHQVGAPKRLMPA
jgi:PKD repeat protein